MSTFANQLKSEIARISKKEINYALKQKYISKEFKFWISNLPVGISGLQFDGLQKKISQIFDAHSSYFKQRIYTILYDKYFSY
jgi:hypothetical protein